jgi:hypothetical protein
MSASSHMTRSASPGARLGLLAVLATAGCGITEPSANPLDVRAGTATIYGQVFAPLAPGANQPRPVPGAVIELARWQGGPYDFRDSLRGRVAAAPDDPRFRVVAHALADDTGRYRLPGVPRAEIFALRARPPAGTPYRVTYLGSLFGLRNVTEARFSILLEAP